MFSTYRNINILSWLSTMNKVNIWKCIKIATFMWWHSSVVSVKLMHLTKWAQGINSRSQYIKQCLLLLISTKSIPVTWIEIHGRYFICDLSSMFNLLKSKITLSRAEPQKEETSQLWKPQPQPDSQG